MERFPRERRLHLFFSFGPTIRQVEDTLKKLKLDDDPNLRIMIPLLEDLDGKLAKAYCE